MPWVISGKKKKRIKKLFYHLEHGPSPEFAFKNSAGRIKVCQHFYTQRHNWHSENIQISLVHRAPSTTVNIIVKYLHIFLFCFAFCIHAADIETVSTISACRQYKYMQANFSAAPMGKTVSQVTSQPQHAYYFSVSFSLSPIQFLCFFFLFCFL